MGQRSSVLPIADETIPPHPNNGIIDRQNMAIAPSAGSNNGGVMIGTNHPQLNHHSHHPHHHDGVIPKDEYPHFGIVSVQLSWLTANVRYTPEQQSEITVTGKSAIFFGANISSPEIMNELHSHKLFPREISLLDSRAHQLLLTYANNGWYAISSPEIFSRHSGTCIIIGDRQNPGAPYKIQLGDCFRLGSVGVVVSEMKLSTGGVEKKLDNKRLQYLREEALAFETDQDEAALAAEEEEIFTKKKQKSSVGPNSGGVGGGVGVAGNDENTSYNFQDGGGGSSPFFCYMCYETHDTPEDHLVAPCDCKGDTRYLHVQCLQKWYQSSVCGSQANVIRTTSNGAPACKICGAAYKTAFRNNGVKTSLLEVDHPGPYVSLVVVTRHDTSPGLFNTKFRLNFGPNINRPDEEGPSDLSIGRSSLCNMVLDYRTVSTVHAKLIYKNGEFYVQDTHSSNGTMVYLQGPLPLVNNQTVRLRMGRSTLALQAKRSFSASIRGTLQRAPMSTPCTASLAQLQHIMSLAPPYIPRSIRQVDQASPTDQATVVAAVAAAAAAAEMGGGGGGGGSSQGEPSTAIAATATAAAAASPAFRMTDWIQNIQNQAMANVSTAAAAPASAAPAPPSSHDSSDLNALLGLDSGRGGAGGGVGVGNGIMEAPPGREISSFSPSPSSPANRLIEFSSTLLPGEILPGGGSGRHVMDAPLVLSGDRVSSLGGVGSRPNSV